MLKRRVTTRQIENVDFDDYGNIIEISSSRPEMDDALSMLAFLCFREVDYSGEIKTFWRDGGMREPQTPGCSKAARQAIIVNPMKKLLPDKYSGWAIWRVNSGELSGGGPELIP